MQGKSDSPAKRKTKPTGKRTGGRPTRKLQTSGMSLQTEIPVGILQANNNNIPQTATSNTKKHEDDEEDSSENSPKNTTEPLRKSTRNRQAALSHAFGNPVPINTIEDKKDEETKRPIEFQIDSPSDKQSNNSPSLKLLIQEMGFTAKTPQYKACIRFIEVISPKHKTDHTEVVDLTSPSVADEPIDTSNETLFIKAKTCQESAVDSNKISDDDEK